ncbi:hypothetical protein, partial [Hymenobacter sp. IS2118]|uniref:hypothetical protein n=1 Tax=Hymenobacter sp. IS2118 TaxID=1505605 RepID=UPI0005553A1A
EYLIQRNGVGSWVRTSSVATSTASFHPVVMDYVGAKPWTLYDAYQAKYNKAAAATKPSWGPAIPAGRQYYYIPEINGFYDAITREYLIQRNGVGSWVRTSSV